MLDRLSKKHNLWLKMLINLGCDNDIAEDIVQEMYIRLHDRVDDIDRILINDEINTYFVYITLRNLFISHIRSTNKLTIYPLIDGLEFEQHTEDVGYHEMESAYFTYLHDKIKDVLKTFDAQERLIYDFHFVKGQSLRKIHRESGVGKTSINNTYKNIKRKLRNALMEDLEDYYNEDFNIKF